MNKYELTLVISSKVEEDVRNATLDRAKALIERFGGKISEVEDAGKKRLAYEIQKMREGFYYFIKFEAEPTAPAEIESRVRIYDNVLRYLIVSEEE
jgi:small subunit ribosomal protein S6